MMDSSIFDRNSQSNKDKTVYLITRRFNSQCVEDLLRELSLKSINVQIQRQTDTLGLKMNKRYFVVVDNSDGPVSLGPVFSSLLMFIVGYPRIGPNKKNHYCSTVSDVLEKYRYYCELPEYSKTIFQASNFKSKSRLSSRISEASNHSQQTAKNQRSVSILSKKQSEGGVLINERSKLFLLVSKKQQDFNKWIFKIAANNPVKFKIVEDIPELTLSLSVCRTPNNFLICQSTLLDEVVAAEKDIKILLFCQKSLGNKYFIKNPNILKYCYTHKDLINGVRQIGFQVVSLKDIDKSIVKYHSTRSKGNEKNKFGKKIFWASSQNLEPFSDQSDVSKPIELQIQTNKELNRHNISTSIHQMEYGVSASETQMKQNVAPVQIRPKRKVITIKYKTRSASQSKLTSNDKSLAAEQGPNLRKRVKKVKNLQSEIKDMTNNPSQEPDCSGIQQSIETDSKKIKKRKLVLPESASQRYVRSLSAQPAFYYIKQPPNQPISPASGFTEDMKSPRKILKNIKIQKQTHRAIIYPQRAQDNQQERSNISSRSYTVNFSATYPTYGNQNSPAIAEYYGLGAIQKKQKFGLLWKQFNQGITTCRDYFMSRFNVPSRSDKSFFNFHQLNQRIAEIQASQFSWLIFLDDISLENSLRMILESTPSITHKIGKIYVVSKRISHIPEFKKHVDSVTKLWAGTKLVRPLFINEYSDELQDDKDRLKAKNDDLSFLYKIINIREQQIDMKRGEEGVEEGENWQEECKRLAEKLANVEHEHKKMSIEIRTDLEFERKRADEFEEKYKNAIRYKNEQEELKTIMSELSEKLKNKENQILEYMKSEQEKKRKIAELDELNQQLSQSNEDLNTQLAQIQQGAISALLEKEGIIGDLEQKIIELQSVDTHGLKTCIIELEEKYRELEDRAEAEKKDLQEVLAGKEEQMMDLSEKFQVQRERYEERIAVLEQDVITYEKHIDKITEEKHDGQNLEERCYMLEEKQRKTEKKLHDAEVAFKAERQTLVDCVQEMEGQISSLKGLSEEIKVSQTRIKELEKELKTSKREVEESKATTDKVKSDYLKKITQLEQQKKKLQDSLQIRSQELDRMRNQLEEVKPETTKQKDQTPEKDRFSLATDIGNMPATRLSNKKDSLEDAAVQAQIDKLKAQISSLQQHIDQLNNQLEETTKQTQQLRERLVQSSGSAGRSEGEAELLVQIEDLNSYIKKVEHNLMITKLKYAEDESHWSSRESELKKQVDRIDRKSKKQKGELLERIDRMKKSAGAKDKKMDYYQSSLK